MSNGKKGHFKPGKGETLEQAAAHAWENARASGEEPGTYLVSKIEIVAENPIRGYIVTIEPPGG